MKDDDPLVMTTIDPEAFVKDLKELDPNEWDQLPCNIM